MTIEDKIATLSVQKGDIVVVRAKEPMSKPQHDYLKATVQEALTAAGHSEVPVLIFDDGIIVETLRVGEQYLLTTEELNKLVTKAVQDSYESVQRNWERFRS